MLCMKMSYCIKTSSSASMSYLDEWRQRITVNIRLAIFFSGFPRLKDCFPGDTTLALLVPSWMYFSRTRYSSKFVTSKQRIIWFIVYMSSSTDGVGINVTSPFSLPLCCTCCQNTPIQFSFEYDEQKSSGLLGPFLKNLQIVKFNC